MGATGRTLWLLCAGALTISLLHTPDGLPDIIVCPSRLFWGVACGGCGLTRSFSAISHGAFHEAWSFNPFGFVFYTLTLAVLLYPVLTWVRPAWAQRVVGWASSWHWALLLGLAVAVFGAWRSVYG